MHFLYFFPRALALAELASAVPLTSSYDAFSNTGIASHRRDYYSDAAGKAMSVARSVGYDSAPYCGRRLLKQIIDDDHSNVHFPGGCDDAQYYCFCTTGRQSLIDGWFTTTAQLNCPTDEVQRAIDLADRWCDAEAGVTRAPSSPVSGKPPKTPPALSSTVASAAGVKPPAPAQSGVSESCKKWAVQKGSGYCEAMEEAAGISHAAFVSLNPAVKSDCSNMWPGYAYCVGS